MCLTFLPPPIENSEVCIWPSINCTLECAKARPESTAILCVINYHNSYKISRHCVYSIISYTEPALGIFYEA